ncbi:MAG: hypothetical protein EA344_05635, partial [Alkalicoccus sp.]
REDLPAFFFRRRLCPGIGFTEERTAFTKSRTYLFLRKTKRKPARGRRRLEDPTERKQEEAENLLHGRPVGSEMCLQPSANFNIAYQKTPKKAVPAGTAFLLFSWRIL